MLIVWFFAYKKLAQFAVWGALPPRRSESPVCATDNKPSCVLHLLDWFKESRGFSSLERRPEFWVLQYHGILLLKCDFHRSVNFRRHRAQFSPSVFSNLQLMSQDPHKMKGTHISTEIVFSLSITKRWINHAMMTSIRRALGLSLKHCTPYMCLLQENLEKTYIG